MSDSQKMANALAFYSDGNFDEALKCLDRLIEESPEDGASLFLKSEILYHAGKLEESAAAVEKAIRLSEEGVPIQQDNGLEPSDLYDTLGDILLRIALNQDNKSRLPEAKSACQKSLALKPNDTAVLKRLASAHGSMTEFDDAKALYTALLGIDPEDKEALFELSRLEKYESGMLFWRAWQCRNDGQYSEYRALIDRGLAIAAEEKDR